MLLTVKSCIRGLTVLILISKYCLPSVPCAIICCNQCQNIISRIVRNILISTVLSIITM